MLLEGLPPAAVAGRGGVQVKLPDVEVVSAKIHEAWMKGKRAKGITSRRSESGEELMAPYSELSDAAKDLDRLTVQAVYAAIEEASK